MITARLSLPAGERAAFDALLPGLLEARPSMPMPPLEPSAVSGALHAILLDHPELFWFEGKWSLAEDRLWPRYAAPIALQPRFLAAAQEALAEIQPQGRDGAGIEALARIHDWLLRRVVYDPSAPHSQSAYGALVERRALCKGIAKAFQLLALRCGFDAACVEGSIGGAGRHVWNAVELDGATLHVDVTMDYPRFASLRARMGLPAGAACFCVDDEVLRRTHRWDTGAPPFAHPNRACEGGGTK